MADMRQLLGDLRILAGELSVGGPPTAPGGPGGLCAARLSGAGRAQAPEPYARTKELLWH
ncbi:hypothetical protein [Streptomyces lydicamycinicus]|uniref:Uncharacterized protein n=1 Tax=Streptomyces lydicamycinicus TaxID=1546107 RepID=A0A0P4RDN5_9ACTN|nr:hypothetical protein [Streptomyces lydicamycinicus]GAO11759.1 hypothetical protein TPA0598_09_00500 [Streptomyces lydicamycinicus]